LKAARVCLAFGVVVFATRAQAMPGTAIFWGSGQSDAEAALVLRNLQEFASGANQLMDVPKGFPKIVDNASLRAVPTGSKAVLVGFCDGDTAAHLVALLRTLSPGAFTKDVDVPALACPKVAPEWQPGPAGKVAAGPENSLHVQVFSGPESDRGSASRGFAIAWLIHGNEVLEARVLGGTDCSSHQVVRLDKARLRVVAECQTGNCTVSEYSQVIWTLEASEAIATSRRKGKVVQEMSCDQ